ncbi:MAG: amino acid adenylation domain-containing protein [bacterium]|nr:amino acid adenylation domain-containing protein [bacterium]
MSNTSSETRLDEIRTTLLALMADFLQAAPSEEETNVPFLEMGANSLTLLEVIRSVDSTFGIDVTMRQFFEELTTIEVLATYIDENLPPEWRFPGEGQAEPHVGTQIEIGGTQETESQQIAAPLPNKPVEQEFKFDVRNPGGNAMSLNTDDSELERILAQQLQMASQAMSQLVSQQLEFLRSNGGPEGKEQAQAVPQQSREQKPTQAQPQASQPTSSKSSSPPASKPLRAWDVANMRGRGLNDRQRRHLENLLARFTAKTRKSKEYAQQYRPALSDSRASVGFRFSTKEMLYPIVGKRTQGARLWDIDNNEYLDITMGFGVSLFGSHPDFIMDALHEHLGKTLLLGPRSEFVGEVGELICELTGMERVTFTNSGTEAIMAAMRLARAATGRTKMVMFEDSYHGHSDGTFAFVAMKDGQPSPIPLPPGVPSQMAENMLLLKYGEPESLELIKKHAHELAAVLVEPVQSSRPDLQPVEFLRELRAITQEQGVLLIFDEMITGFRVHPGGAQAYFGIDADIVTYGKIIGGGMPIGVVAGKARHLDAIDGGMWRYGDSSYPQAERTVFGGTFCQHPMAMITAHAVLKHLKEQGPGLQERLNQRTKAFADELNTFFSDNDVPIRIAHFGSLFRFTFSGNLELFFYHMLVKGVYIWEWRNCFLSTAHTDEDVDLIIQAAKASIQELGEGGFLQIPGIQAESTPGIRLVPLNEAQKQLWALAQIGDEESLAYNTYASLKLQGALQMTAMREAVKTAIERHEALRTTIDPNGQLQMIHPSLEIELPIIDLSHSAENARDENVREWFIQESRTPFDLHNGPLFRISFVKLADDFHVFVLTAHHIVVDGWSTSVILREIGEFYSAACQSDVHDSPQSKISNLKSPIPLQLTDFLAWQNQQRWTPAMKQHETYWLKKFAKGIPVLNLPTDRPYPPIKSYHGARHTIRLDEHFGRDALQLGKMHGCTRFMVLFSVYTALLHRLTGQDDILIGIPVLGRPPKDGDTIVAYCTHLLLVCSHLDENATFLEHLKAIRGALFDGYEHQDYPFAELIEKLHVRGDVSRSPLVSAIFNLDQLVIVPEMYGLEIDLVAQPISFTAYDVNLNVTEIDDTLILDCDYNTDVFEPATIVRFLEQFKTILSKITANPEIHVTQLPLLTEAERHKILVEWNDTTRPFPDRKCLHEIFEEQVERAPDAEAVVCGSRSLSYQELNTRANQLAHHLRTFDIGPDVRVGLCIDRSLEMIVGLMGIMKAGGTYVPLDPAYPKERLAFMLEESQAKVLLTQKRLSEAIPAHRGQTICLDADWESIAREDTTNPDHVVTLENLIYVIFTSGSTGRPKGAAVYHRGFMNLVRWYAEDFRLTSEDSTLMISSLSFDLTQKNIFAPLLLGGTLHLLPSEFYDPQQIIRTVWEKKISWLNCTPSAFYPIVEYDENNLFEKLASLRYVFLGGEPILMQRLQKWTASASNHAYVVNSYGPTECADVCAAYIVRQPEEFLEQPVPIGKPISNAQLFVVDKRLSPLPIGVLGELCIAGEGVGPGYINDAELTEKRFPSNPFNDKAGDRMYKTGDLCRYLPDGNIEFLGRMDHQVKLRGFRIELGEIETILSSHPALQEAVVSIRKADSGAEQLVAYIVPNHALTPNINELRRFLSQQLPDYMVPVAFVIMDSLPLTPSGKVDRRALPAPEIASAEAEKPLELTSSTEALLAEIWGKVLGLEKIGIHDNFFDLAGDSILGIQIISRANQAGLNITPRQLFNHPTIAGLATVAGTINIVQAEQGTVTGNVPLTPVQQWFFERQLVEPHHCNQAVLLEAPSDIKPGILKQAVHLMLSHHDALRLRFEYGDKSWQQANQDIKEAIPLTIEDISSLSSEEQQARLAVVTAKQQAGLNLSQGPLIRVVLFQFGHEQPGRVLIVIHHLAIDGVSWRILSEDLQTAYQQIEKGSKAALPDKTTSFQQWACRLTDYARSEVLQQEMNFWQMNGKPDFAPLPVDFPGGDNTETSARTVCITLNPQDTRALLQDVPDVYHTRIDEVLLTALTQTFIRWTGKPSLLLDLEGHGREDVFEDVNLSRTVGWFTSIYPVRLQLPATSELGESLKSIKEQMRIIPNRGFGYGVLRYLNLATRSQLQSQPQGEVLFNYMGQFDQMIAASQLFEPAAESSGRNNSPSNTRSHLLEVVGTVIGGELQMKWIYSKQIHRQETIESLAQDFLTILQDPIAYCQNPEAGGYTPSDFPLANIDESQLETLSVLLDGTE